MFNHYPMCLLGLKKLLDKEVNSIQAAGKYQAHVRFVQAEHYLEVFVREAGVAGANWLTHRQAKRLEKDDAVLPRPSAAQFF